MKARTVAAGAAALALTLSAAACSSSGTSGGSSSGGEIHVLDITGTSGSTSIFGIPETNAMKAAAAYYNARGGILGKKVVIDVVNNNSDPTTTVSVFQKEMSQNPSKYTMVWAGQEGTQTAALIPLLKKYKIFATAVNDGGNDVCKDASACPNFFAQAGSSSFAEVSDTNFLKSQGYKKIGILANEATYTQSELGFLKTDLDQAGISYQVVTFPDTAVNVTPEMTQLKAGNPDAIMALALGPTAGYTLKARQALNWDIPLLFDITGSAGDLSTLVPASALQDVHETIQWCMNPKNTTPAFNQMQKLSPTPLPGNIICSIPGDGWGGIVLLAEAAKKANSLDPAKLVAAANGLTITDNEVSFHTKCWTGQNHDNPCQNADYFEILPAGQLKNGQLYPLGS
jgi:branched-chain amino acid transport system substrate-binding protein